MKKPKHDRDSYPYRYKRGNPKKDAMITMITLVATAILFLAAVLSKQFNLWIEDFQLSPEGIVISLIVMAAIFYIYKPFKRNFYDEP